MKKHLIILGIRGVPAQHGGFESFAEKLVPWMINAGWEVSVYCQGSQTGEKFEDHWQGCRRVHIPVHGNGAISTIEFDIKSTIDAIKSPGVILTLGYNTGFLTILPKLFGLKNIVNMDGVEWRRAKYTTFQKIYLWINEYIASAFANLLVADHPVIAKHLSRHTSLRKIETIPYGAEHVDGADAQILAKFGLTPQSYITVIARPEPENSVLEIVKAFSRRSRGVKLLVLGNYTPENAYHACVLKHASEEVLFPGAIYERQEVNALRFHSLAYVHGHQVGGTNPSLVEALGASNAIIAHKNPFNEWVADKAGIYFKDIDECEYCIDKLISDKPFRDNLKECALHQWATRFTWPMILQSYQEIIERMTNSDKADYAALKETMENSVKTTNRCKHDPQSLHNDRLRTNK